MHQLRLLFQVALFFLVTLNLAQAKNRSCTVELAYLDGPEPMFLNGQFQILNNVYGFHEPHEDLGDISSLKIKWAQDPVFLDPMMDLSLGRIIHLPAKYFPENQSVTYDCKSIPTALTFPAITKRTYLKNNFEGDLFLTPKNQNTFVLKAPDKTYFDFIISSREVTANAGDLEEACQSQSQSKIVDVKSINNEAPLESRFSYKIDNFYPDENWISTNPDYPLEVEMVEGGARRFSSLLKNSPKLKISCEDSRTYQVHGSYNVKFIPSYSVEDCQGSWEITMGLNGLLREKDKDQFEGILTISAPDIKNTGALTLSYPESALQMTMRGTLKNNLFTLDLNDWPDYQNLIGSLNVKCAQQNINQRLEPSFFVMMIYLQKALPSGPDQYIYNLDLGTSGFSQESNIDFGMDPSTSPLHGKIRFDLLEIE